MRLGGPFCIVACFRIQISSAEQFKTRLGTKMGPLASTKRFRAASGPETNSKGVAEKNPSQTKSREKPDHQIEDESRARIKETDIKMAYLRRAFLSERMEETTSEFECNKCLYSK